MFVSNLNAYERGEPEKHAALRPTEIKDAQIRNIFFIGAGLSLVEEEVVEEEAKLKGQKRTRIPRQQAIKQLLSDLYTGTAPQLLENRPKVADIKDACFELRSSRVLEEASPQPRQLRKLVKDLEDNRVSDCVHRVDADKCKDALKKYLDCLRQRGIPEDLERKLRRRIETEIKGLHFYMVFRNLRTKFNKSPALHKDKKKFKDALNACESAYRRMEEIFRVEKAASPKREENLENNRRDKGQAHQSRPLNKTPTKTPSMPPVETQMKEEVRDRRQFPRTDVIQVKSAEQTPEPEKQETTVPQEEQYQSEISRLQREFDEEKRRTKALEALKLKEENSQLENTVSELKKDLQMLTHERKSDGEDRLIGKEEDELSREEKWAKKLQRKANEDKEVLQGAVERLQNEIEKMPERHQVEYNRLKADVISKSSELQRLQQRLYEEAQKRLAENSQVEQLSDPNRPSEVAKRYGDLFQKTYDVAEVLEDNETDEDDCNRFIVEMLIISSNAAKEKFTEYESSCAKIHGLSEEDNQTAKKTLKESVTCLLRLASATRKQKDSEDITKIALSKVKKTFSKYHIKEIASAIEEFLISASSVTWEVAISLRETDFVLDDKTFDEALHERFTGSDPKVRNVKSIVWPRLAERLTGKTLCKGRVVTGV
ncbi:trichohyalin-like [Oscarella lobularis]|uniref:trichohyalin-like n=1 Tax=Oscarella lobularis TaxID=121494 RepID=UPI00331382B7